MHNTLTGKPPAVTAPWGTISSDLVLAAQKALVHNDSKNEKAVLGLIVQCEKKVTSFILSRMRRKNIARGTGLQEDVTHEVILILLKSSLIAYKVEQGATFDTYLLKIADRIFNQVVRRAQAIPSISESEASVQALNACLESSYTYENNQLTRVALAEALHSLSEKERDAVLRHVFDTSTFQEIADEWEMPLSTTYRHIKNAIAKLRRQLISTEPQPKENLIQ